MKTDNTIIDQFLATFAPAHAIPRINEALEIRKLPFISPILDFGCGDGRYAKILFEKNKVDVGLDPNPAEIKKAVFNKVYQVVATEYGNQMSFPSGKFKTVLANSVMEHIVNLDEVLAEINRVMVKNGKFVLTVPTPLVSKYLLFNFIPGYAKFKEKLWRHYNYFGEEKWRERLTKAGFKIEQITKTNSKKAIMVADLFFPLFPLGPLPFFADTLKKMNIFGNDNRGATLVIVAVKKTNAEK